MINKNLNIFNDHRTLFQNRILNDCIYLSINRHLISNQLMFYVMNFTVIRIHLINE